MDTYVSNQLQSTNFFSQHRAMPTVTRNPVSHPLGRRSTEDRQQEIVMTVLALAEARGVEAITTQAIAEHMGLTQGAVFRHFLNKEAIWAAVLDWLQGKLGEIFQRRPDASALGELERIFSGYMDFMATYPAMPRLVFSDTFHHAHPALHRRVRDLVAGCEGRLCALIDEAAAVGDLRSGNAAAGAKLLLTAIQGLAFQSAILGLVADLREAGPPLFALWRGAMTCEGMR
jgi:TetR/AcrR family transcriptional regulator